MHPVRNVMMKTFLFFFLLVHGLSVNCQSSLLGCYVSNFAIIGWFGTNLELNEDKSFTYLFAGDLYYDKIEGTYELVKNEVILTYPACTDSLEISFRDSIGNLVSRKFPLPENNAANYRPSKLRIKRNKLVIYDQHGKRVCRKMNSREKWQKYFLVKTPCD